MAINPVSLPDVDFTVRSLRLANTKSVAQMRSRRTESAESGTPYWIGDFVAIAKTKAEDRLIDAFIGDMQRAGATFLAFDQFFCRPITYPREADYPGAFVGTGTITTITNSRELDLGGFAAGTVLKRGDRIEIYQSALKRSLHRITADVTADGSGDATVNIEPGLNTDVFADTDTFNVELPSCVMEMVEFEMPQNPGMRLYRFKGIEVFY